MMGHNDVSFASYFVGPQNAIVIGLQASSFKLCAIECHKSDFVIMNIAFVIASEVNPCTVR
jgi:hypothetical protein